MLGLPSAILQEQVDKTNSFLSYEKKIYVALMNGPRFHVCTGHPQSLYGLNLALRKMKAQADQDQSRVPFSQRKARFVSRFLPVTVPFHCNYLADVPHLIQQDILDHDLNFHTESLKIPVFNTHTGKLIYFELIQLILNR